MGRTEARLSEGSLCGGQLGAPDFARIVFDPTGLGEVLGEGLLGLSEDVALGIEDDGT
jgi:hypothetical protein